MKYYLIYFLILIQFGCPIAEQEPRMGISENECKILILTSAFFEQNAKNANPDFTSEALITYTICINQAKKSAKTKKAEKYFNVL